MAKKMQAAAGIEVLRRWQKEGEEIVRDLRARRVEIVRELDEIDQALKHAEPAALKVVTARTVKAPRDALLVPRKHADVPAELQELRPFWGQLKPDTKEAVKLRAAGKMPVEIAAALKMKPIDVSQRIYAALTKMRAARQTGADPAQHVADGDGDGEDPGQREQDGKKDEAGVAVDASPAAPASPAELVPATSSNSGPTDEQLAELDATPLATIRRKVAGAAGRVRAKTLAPRGLSRDERRLKELLVYPEDVARPSCRAECTDMPRPCPFVSCSHHLFLDVNPQTGAIKLNFPHLEVWEMAETCSLDVADRGGITLEQVGQILNLTRERIRQVEVRGLDKLRDQADDLDVPPDRQLGPLASVIDS